MGRINYGGIDMDVVVNFKSNKIQLVMDKRELSHNMLTLTSPRSHSAVCELRWFFGDYDIPQGEIKIGPIRVEPKRRHRGLRPPYR